jgi:hypothetical protein
MKKFCLKLFLHFGLPILGMGGLIFLLPYPENTYNLAILDKHRLLAAAESPKLVLVGGSNVAFGVDSAAIRERLYIPVVNMGVTINFGLGRILDDVSPFLNPGDTLLVIPEYQHFAGLWNGGSDA